MEALDFDLNFDASIFMILAYNVCFCFFLNVLIILVTVAFFDALKSWHGAFIYSGGIMIEKFFNGLIPSNLSLFVLGFDFYFHSSVYMMWL